MFEQQTIEPLSVPPVNTRISDKPAADFVVYLHFCNPHLYSTSRPVSHPFDLPFGLPFIPDPIPGN
jgi:hypothetical protein